MKFARLSKTIRERMWRVHLADINFGYVLFAVAVIWLSGLATLEYLSD